MVYIYQHVNLISGATLGKGLNRGLATLVAGALGIGAHHLASLSGHIGEPILLGVFVFLQGKYIYLLTSSIKNFLNLLMFTVIGN